MILHKGMFFAIFMLAIGSSSAIFAKSGQVGKEDGEWQKCVILLHGLARTKTSMRTIQADLDQRGYHVVNLNYPSRENTISQLAQKVLPQARAECANDHKPHVVTHSMGGILLRIFANENPNLEWGRVVMLAPPNHGSGIIDAYKDQKWFLKLNGPAALELASDGITRDLPPLPFETGIIAGNQSLNPFTSRLVDGIDDGKVSISSTKVEGMKDHTILPVTHTFMMRNREVIEKIAVFLEEGSFDHLKR